MPDHTTVAPVNTPITAATAKERCKVDHTDEDDLFDRWIEEATERFQERTWSALITQTRVMTMRSFRDPEYVLDGVIYVPKPPLQSVTSIQYVDEDGDTQTWASSNYDVDAISKPGRIETAYNATYPATRDQVAAVTITYVAGYGDDPADVPQVIRGKIAQYVGWLRDNREGQEPPPGFLESWDLFSFRNVATVV